MPKLAGLVLIIGSLLFVIAAFTPITMKVVTATDPQKRAEYIRSDRTGWILVNLLFVAGSTIAVGGLAIFAVHTQVIGVTTDLRLVSYLGPAAAAFGTALWVIISYNRAALPPEEVANNLVISSWAFPAYTILMQVALLLVGFVMIQSGYPGWMGWGMFGLGVLSVVAYLLFKDMPPFAHYVPLLVMGIALVR